MKVCHFHLSCKENLLGLWCHRWLEPLLEESLVELANNIPIRFLQLMSRPYRFIHWLLNCLNSEYVTTRHWTLWKKAFQLVFKGCLLAYLLLRCNLDTMAPIFWTPLLQMTSSEQDVLGRNRPMQELLMKNKFNILKRKKEKKSCNTNYQQK